jgi:hypothetical protein
MATTTTFNKYGREVSISVQKAVKSQYRKKSGMAYPLSANLNKVTGDATLFGKRTGAYFSKAYGINLIKNNLRQLLRTERGERVMLPDFGVSLRKYIFEPMDEVTFILIKQEVLGAITKYFPQAQVLAVSVMGGEEGNEHLLKISLTLQLRDSSLDTFEADIEVK